MTATRPLDDAPQLVREAGRSIVEAAADLALARSRKIDLGKLCRELGVEVERVRERAAQLRLRH